MLLSVFVIGIFVFSGCIGQEEEVEGVHPLDGVTVEMGALLANPLTQEQEQISFEIAEEEVNAYAQKIGIDFKMDILFEACEGSAVKAAEKFDTLVARGVKYVGGLRWSSHCKAILEKANEQKVLLFSDGSTTPLLEIEDDWLFRLPTTDVPQGRAIARIMTDYGLEAIVGVLRKDTWGDGLWAPTEERFEELGGTITEKIEYDPEKVEFSAEADLLNGYVTNALAQYGQDKVGVLYIGFDSDGIALQTAVASYPTLMSVPWIGSDGHARTTSFIQEVADDAVKIRHISTYIGVDYSDNYWTFAEEYKARVGWTPQFYDCAAYDSVWILGKAMLEASSVDSEVVKSILPQVAGMHYGSTGWCKLNNFGDRASGKYDIWAVFRPEESLDPDALVPNANEIGWEYVGIYDPIADSVVWYHPIPMTIG